MTACCCFSVPDVVAAALITWVLVTRLLIRPLRRLERAVVRYEPGESVDLPSKLGPSKEIQELRDAFARAVARVEESEREMSGALEGQRRLVREVHHRVKNNLQVVASLLNIHGRSAETPDARAAYAGSAAGSARFRSSTATISRRWRKIAGSRFGRWFPNWRRSFGPERPEAARALKIDLDIDSGQHDAGRRRRGGFPDHRNRRVRDAPTARQTRSRSRCAGPAS